MERAGRSFRLESPETFQFLWNSFNFSNVNERIDSQRETVLHSACFNLENSQRSVELLQVLFKNGAKVDPLNIQGETPLFYAVRRLKPLFVHELLQHGADPNRRSKRGTVLEEVFESLLDLCGRYEIQHIDAIPECIGVAVEILKVLLESGADAHVEPQPDQLLIGCIQSTRNVGQFFSETIQKAWLNMLKEASALFFQHQYQFDITVTLLHTLFRVSYSKNEPDALQMFLDYASWYSRKSGLRAKSSVIETYCVRSYDASGEIWHTGISRDGSNLAGLFSLLPYAMGLNIDEPFFLAGDEELLFTSLWELAQTVTRDPVLPEKEFSLAIHDWKQALAINNMASQESETLYCRCVRTIRRNEPLFEDQVLLDTLPEHLIAEDFGYLLWKEKCGLISQ